MVCAFVEGDTQYPCDPGCCENSEKDGTTGDGTTGDDGKDSKFPIWVIILLTVLGAAVMGILLAWAAKKMSKNK
jgi:plastocyanin domain-containing protein